VAEFLDRDRYERGDEFRGYRNGYLPEGTIRWAWVLSRCTRRGLGPAHGGGAGAVPLRDHESYQRRSRTQARLLVRLYLEWIASGDFEPVVRVLLRKTTRLSMDTS
jgi:hypothetical protein